MTRSQKSRIQTHILSYASTICAILIDSMLSDFLCVCYAEPVTPPSKQVWVALQLGADLHTLPPFDTDTSEVAGAHSEVVVTREEVVKVAEGTGEVGLRCTGREVKKCTIVAICLCVPT